MKSVRLKFDKGLWAPRAAVPLVVVVALAFAPGGWAQVTFKTLHKFTGGKGGGGLWSGLIFDQEGDLYGTSTAGGASGLGTVFELSRDANGKWSHKVLHNFGSGEDGRGPVAGLIFDGAGNLYGTTILGGDLACNYPSGCGVVFELTPNADGRWKERVLHRFKGGKYGEYPYGGVTFDSAGNLYGTTLGGGAGNGDYGVVFELTPHVGGSWSEKVLYKFTDGTDGSNPYVGLLFDKARNLYGAACCGGHTGMVRSLSWLRMRTEAGPRARCIASAPSQTAATESIPKPPLSLTRQEIFMGRRWRAGSGDRNLGVDMG